MANQMRHNGSIPECMYVVSITDEKTFWVYIKEGHAINRLLKERRDGKSARLIKFCEAMPSEQVNA